MLQFKCGIPVATI